MRRAFDTAQNFAEAKDILTTAPIAAPAIYSLAGVRADETCVIERTETAARVYEGEAVAANHWQPETPGAHVWRGRSRGVDSKGRAAMMPGLDAKLDPDFSWAKWPVLNSHTRLIMVADASQGRLVAQGYEADGPATEPLELTVQ